MAQDTFQQAKERYDDCVEAWRENYERMSEDLRFSNPADPQQWHKKTRDERDGRPLLTLDQTNQFVQQVVNDGRQNTPSIQVTPGDDRASMAVALKQAERLRYLEYRSKAGVAYDTSLEGAARIGLGWMRVVPAVVDERMGYQEPRILMVHDWLSCRIDGDSVEYDGSDAMFGFCEATIPESVFKRRWPGKRIASFGESNGWFSKAGVRVADYQCVEVKRANVILTSDPEGANPVEMTEEQYHEVSQKTGVQPRYVSNDPNREVGRVVKWYQMSGCEILDAQEFPCKWIGLVPVYGHVVWVDGKRYVCGMVRQLADGQRFHNYEMSSLAEVLLSQPTAPFMAPARAIKGHESHWQQLNKGNPAYLPYNDVPDDEADPPIAPPIRLGPPQFPNAYASGAQLGVQAMQAGVGMYKSNLGQQSNAVSGRAKMADRVEGDTATYHYGDNQRRSIEHVARICLDMDARLTDTKRTVRTLSLDEKPGTVVVDPNLQGPVREVNGKVEAINPTHGTYDTRVKVGPGYTTVREEMKDRLVQIGQANPPLAAALAPLLVKLEDLPESDKIMRVCLALLPPEVQQAYSEGEDDGAPVIPPQVQGQIDGMKQQLEQAGAMLQQLAEQLQQAQAAASDQALRARELEIKEREATARGVEADAKLIAAEADMVRAQAEAAQVDDLAALSETVQRTRDQIASLFPEEA